jgi:hypothetical protein
VSKSDHLLARQQLLLQQRIGYQRPQPEQSYPQPERISTQELICRRTTHWEDLADQEHMLTLRPISLQLSYNNIMNNNPTNSNRNRNRNRNSPPAHNML